MKKLTETQKSIIKWAFVLVLLGLIVYVFRDMAGAGPNKLVGRNPPAAGGEDKPLDRRADPCGDIAVWCV